MFAEMRSVLGIPSGTDILGHIYSLPPSEQETAMEKIRNIERNAIASQLPQPGLLTLMTYLESKAMPKGICTRNFETPVNHLLSKFLAGQLFSPIITRDFKPPKPDPAGILHIAKTWGFEDARELIMVG
jgi:phosphoglycolate phosphatase-like HAD superfamily hydrolase